MRLRRSPTRFGSRALVRERGRIGRPGTVRETGFETESAAHGAAAPLHGQKERCGYRAREGDGAQRQTITTIGLYLIRDMGYACQ